MGKAILLSPQSKAYLCGLPSGVDSLWNIRDCTGEETSMYRQLSQFAQKPEPFAHYTTDTLWTDPHIGRQMLGFHLDPTHDAASRRASTIDATVEWMDRRFGLSGKRVLDLGCGPGLYATRFASLGASVTGLDFSPVSIAHASANIPEGADLRFVEGNYLEAHLPGPADIVTLIYGDYCALSPDRRRTLLANIAEIMPSGSRFAFDVFSTGQFAEMRESEEFGHRYMGGFWSEADYFGFKRTELYPAQQISLERYLIAAESGSFEVFNWMQYFTPETITDELAESGFAVDAVVDMETGQNWAGGATPFFVIARGPAS
jgi:SAM-dependent methyltransferase